MQVARFNLTTDILPPLTETLRLAETVRYNLMGIYGRQTMCDGIKGNSPIFSGKNPDGSRRLSHRHCHYLPTSEIEDSRIDHLTLFATEGFGPTELRALIGLHSLKPRKNHTSLSSQQVNLVSIGSASDLRFGLLKSSKSWISTTPFLAPDHPKTRGRWRDTERGGSDPHRFLVAQAKKELSRWLKRNSSAVPLKDIEVELLLDESGNSRRLDPTSGAFKESATEFRRSRWKPGDDGGRRLAGFFRITFPKEINGPLALGYSSHFGLGLFLPID